MTPEELDAIKRGGDLYALGVMPSGPRATDYLAPDPNPGAAPASWYHPGYRKVPVRNQQGSTCVSNSLATCMTLLEYVEKGRVINFEAESWSARTVGLQYGPGAAASPHDLLDDAIKHGVPSVVDGTEGQYYPKAYAFLDYTNPDAIREALSTPGQVVTGAVWLQDNFGAGGGTDAGGRPLFNGKDFVPYVDGAPWGLHEITYVGYEAAGAVIQNSWGNWWGDDGFGRLSWDYIAKRSTEMLTVTDSPDNAGGYVQDFAYGTLPEVGIKHPDTPTRKRPATYLVKSNGLIWIKDPTEAKRFGVRLPATTVPDTDSRWGLPVIGQDAPANLR